MDRILSRVLVLTSCLSAPIAAQESVKLYYDKATTPHIFADTDEGALYGLGYHHMRDYPLATLDALWFSSGRMAEIAGECYLQRDQRIQLWEVPVVAQRHATDLAANAPDILSMLEAYVQGVEAGRAWWRAVPARIDALLGTQGEVHVHPVPSYLNTSTGPFAHDTAAVSNILHHRLFSADYPITLAHVLRLGIALNSGPGVLYADNRNVQCQAASMEAESDGEVLGSNGWMLSSGGSGGPIFHSGIHTVWDRLHLRMGFVQVRGETFQAFGANLPGHPAIALGFNDFLAWSITAAPKGPVAGNAWEVGLLGNADFRYMFWVGNQGTKHKLQQVITPLEVYDPVEDQNWPVPFAYKRYYAPEPNTALGLPNNRYPVVQPDSIAGLYPAPSTTVRFEQAAFTVEGSPYEFWLGLGRARNAREDVDDVIARARFLFGDGDNWFFADRDGWLRYILLSRVPVQGATGTSDPFHVLNGAVASSRWAGWHPWQDSPKIDPAQPTSAEAWIVNNCTPDLVSPAHPIDLASFPDHVIAPTTVTTWRQDWARELFGAPSVFTQDDSAAAAIDQTDIWMHRMWPYFQTAAAQPAPVLGEKAGKFLAWVQDHRHLDECDQVDPDPQYDFVAHRMSQVTVWTTLLRFYYLEKLSTLTTDALQASFGDVPDHALFGQPMQTFVMNYAPNVLAMKWALEKIADPALGGSDPFPDYPPSGLWYLGSGPGGLANAEVLQHWSACMLTPPDPWGLPSECDGHACGSSSRYEDNIACASPNGATWASLLPWSRVLRWGHANMIALTPHKLPVPPARLPPYPEFPCVPIRSIASALQTRPLPESELCNSHVCSAPGERLDCFPDECGGQLGAYYALHRPVAVPIGGSAESLFTQRQFTTSFGGPNYLDALYPWADGKRLYYNAVDQGSHVLFTVQLNADHVAGKYLAINGATEITRVFPDAPIDPELFYQDRYATSEAFAAGEWLDVVTKESTVALSAMHLVTVTFTP